MEEQQGGGYLHPALQAKGRVRLAVGCEELLSPAERTRIHEGLEAALVAAGVGRVTGANTSAEPNEYFVRSTIEVEVGELEVGIRVLRHSLRRLEVPAATWIWQFEPEEVCYEVWFDEDNPPTWGW